MVVPSVGEIVIVRFPFADLTASKVRPAACIAGVGRGDWVLAQITSSSYGDPLAVPLTSGSFQLGGLRTASYLRPGKLFTANRSPVLRSIGKLTDAALQSILKEVVNLLRPGTIA